MTTRSVTHGEFTIEREYDAPPEPGLCGVVHSGSKR